MYDLGGKLLNGIKGMYVNVLVCVSVKGGESECFRINSVERQGCVISPWLFNVYMDGMRKQVKMGMGRRSEVSGGYERMEIAWPLGIQMTWFYVVSWRKT